MAPFQGQPFFLDHLRTMAKMANDPDSEYFEVLKHGVPLGVDIPPLRSPGIWPTKEELKGESQGDAPTNEKTMHRLSSMLGRETWKWS